MRVETLAWCLSYKRSSTIIIVIIVVMLVMSIVVDSHEMQKVFKIDLLCLNYSPAYSALCSCCAFIYKANCG